MILGEIQPQAVWLIIWCISDEHEGEVSGDDTEA